MTESSLKKVASTPSVGSVHLDGLRGAAAILVFANHSRALYFTSLLDSSSVGTESVNHSQTTAAPDFYGEIKIASEAVVIFFVLSGYLVGGSVLRSLRASTWSWSTYFTKRLTRLYVVLIPAILIGAALDFAGMRFFGAGSVYTGPNGLQLVTTSDLAARLGPLTMLGNALFLENILVPYIGSNASIWSLANEFWYYVAFPLGVLALRTDRTWSLRILWGCAACLILVFVGWRIAILFPIWILGALVSLLPLKLSLRQAKVLSVVSGLILIVVMLWVRLLHLEAVRAEYIVSLAASFFVWMLIQQTDPAKAGIYKTITGFFSRISYSLYLFHLPIAMFLCGLFNSPWHGWAKTPANIAKFVAIDTLLVVCVYGLWRLFEANTDLIRMKIFKRERAIAR